MMGPEGSPYQGGIFHVDILLPCDFPFKPPLCRFTTKLFHPNISPDSDLYHPILCPGGGEININILTNDQDLFGSDCGWSPALSIPKVLLSIQALLADPNPLPGFKTLNPEASKMLLVNRDEYNRTVQD